MNTEITTTSNGQPGSTSDADGVKRKSGVRSFVKAQYLNDISKAEQITLIMQKPELADADIIGADALEGLVGDVATAKAAVTETVQKSTDRQATTLVEKAVRRELLNILRQIQARAKQKHNSDNRVVLRDYFVGRQIGRSRAMLKQVAESIIEKITTDPLPGAGADVRNQLVEKLARYKAVQTVQTTRQSEAMQARARLRVLMKRINARRREIQFAVNALWPANHEGNNGVRREFFLRTRAVKQD